MKSNSTFAASIYVGTRHGYSDDKYSSVDEIRQWLQSFCNEIGFGVTLTPTEFIYVEGNEPGVIIGIINYPRFPKPIKEIKENAIAIAQGLMDLCCQERVSVVFSDETVMLEKND